MKSSLVFFFLLIPILSSAKFNDCYKEVTQADKNECMLYERDLAVGKLMEEVTTYCSKQDEIKEAKGGSIYPMLVDECMAKKLNQLTGLVDEKN